MLKSLRNMHSHVRSLWMGTDGNIAISAAASLPLVIGSLALAVDYGTLTLERRAAQNTADLAAIVAAGSLDDPETAVATFLRDNGHDYLIETESGYLDPHGETKPSADEHAGLLVIDRGRYVADPALPPADRFRPTKVGANAARVRLAFDGELHFASLFTEPPRIETVGTAHAADRASFSIGSRLLSLDGGILNTVLGSLLGSELSLSVMDYEALIAADISLVSFFDALATELDLEAATYDELLAGSASVGQLTDALAKTRGPSQSTSSILARVAGAASGNTKRIALASLFDPGPLANTEIGTDPGLAIKAAALDMLSAFAAMANGAKQVAVNIEAGLPGIASVRTKLAIGEPPVETSWIAVGDTGATVRTAQTRLHFEVNVAGSGAISVIRLPLYVEVAYGEATLADITCQPNTRRATVSLDARPGVLEAAIGDVRPADFLDFDDEPTVAQARLVDLLLLRVDEAAHLEATNLTTDRVRFTSTDIARGTIKSVHTQQALQSLMSSLLGRLDLDIRLLGFGLGSPHATQRLLADTLAGVTVPLDRLVANTLLALGIRIGEADLRVTGAQCERPVLVQ